MPVAIVVEDGTGKANANSFVSVADYKTLADLYGLTVDADDDVVARQAIMATSIICGMECEFQGTRTYPQVQALSFPRDGMELYGALFPNDKVPPQVIQATAFMADALANGFNPWANTSASDWVIEDTVGPLTTRYADPTELVGGITDEVPAVTNILKPIFGCCNSVARPLRSIRV